MPWRTTGPMDEKLLFVGDCQRELHNMSALCERYGISRTTGYELLARVEADGAAGLVPRSRRPHHSPGQTPAPVVEALLALRRRYGYGPKKLLQLGREQHPRWPWPAQSTAAAILARAQLTQHRRQRRQLGHPGRPTTPAPAPNVIWTGDFKGQFKTLDGVYCYPLTVLDTYSRYLLGCEGLLDVSQDAARSVFEWLFREFGLPDIIRTDNGVPFATCAAARLSRLSVWWVHLGIYPELIQPAHPEQNGRHERFHRTLKAATAIPPAANRAAQQRRFNAWRREYNEQRPHEALGQQTPASRYQASPRELPRTLPDLVYPKHFEVRYVSRNGGIRWHNHWVNISHVLDQEFVGLLAALVEEDGDVAVRGRFPLVARVLIGRAFLRRREAAAGCILDLPKVDDLGSRHHVALGAAADQGGAVDARPGAALGARGDVDAIRQHAVAQAYRGYLRVAAEEDRELDAFREAVLRGLVADLDALGVDGGGAGNRHHGSEGQEKDAKIFAQKPRERQSLPHMLRSTSAMLRPHPLVKTWGHPRPRQSPDPPQPSQGHLGGRGCAALCTPCLYASIRGFHA